jgi:uncharacterized coiled-coil DUF342 family protein
VELASDTEPDLSSLGWEELIALKRKFSTELKELTDRIIDIDKNQFHSLTGSIKEQRTALDSYTERLKQIRAEVDTHNANLLAISDKISQSKNFLSMMEDRLPSEKQEELRAIVHSNQALIDSKDYRSDREKNEIMSRVKDASMKLEAIKATRIIQDQFAQLTHDSASITSSIKILNHERDSLRSKVGEINLTLDVLYDSKRKIGAERESYLARYDSIAKQFDSINARLDLMAEMRRKQREEYGFNLPSDALFKVKEEARKKLESGSKLSFEELKLLYGEKD